MKSFNRIIRNILYLYKEINLKRKSFILFQGMIIILTVLTTIISITLPSIILFLTEHYQSMFSYIAELFLFIILTCLINYLYRYLLNTMETRYQDVKQLFVLKKTKHNLNCPYINLEKSEKVQENYLANLAVTGSQYGIEGIVRKISAILSSIFILIIYLILFYDINVIFMLLILFLSIFNFIGYFRANQYRQTLKKFNWEAYGKANYMKRTAKSEKTAKDIRIFHAQDWLCDKFRFYNNKAHHVFKELTKKELQASILFEITTLLRDLLLYSFILYLALNGTSISYLVLLISSCIDFSNQINELSSSFATCMEASHDIDDYRHYLENKTTVNQSDFVKCPNKIESIEFQDVTFSYDEKAILKNFNLLINMNEKIAIVGLNGAGKTTLIKLLCRFYKPISGCILINGIDIETISFKDYIQLISAVFQDSEFFSGTIIENVVTDHYDEKRLISLFNTLDLADFIDHLPMKEETILTRYFDNNGIILSGGQKQKVMFARALYKQSSLIILDEPTSALDPLAEKALYEQLAQFTQNKISLFISHRLGSTRFCDRIILLENGSIIEDGTHDELMVNKNRYYSLFMTQSKYYVEEGE